MKKLSSYKNLHTCIIAIFFVLLFWVLLVYKTGSYNSDPEIEVMAYNCYEETLHVVADSDYMPYTFYDENGNISGHDVEVITMVANEMKMNLDISFATWDECVDSIVNGGADVLLTCDYFDDFEGSDSLIMTEPISNDEFVIFSKTKVTSTDELYDKKIAVMKNANVFPYLRMLNLDKECMEYENNREALIAVEKGEADCAVVRYTVGEAILKNLGYRDILSYLSIGNSYVCFDVRQDEKELAEKINSVIENLKLTGELEKLHNKWLTSFVHEYNISEIFLNNKWMMVIFALIIVAFLLLAIRAERRTLKYEAQNSARMMALEDKFESLYDVDLENDSYEQFVKGEAFGIVNSKMKHGDNFHEDLMSNMKLVYPDDRNMVIQILETEYIRRSLEHDSYFDCYYRFLNEDNPVWARMRIIYKDAYKRNVIIGIFNAEEEMTSRKIAEQTRKEQIAKMTAGESLYIVNPDTGKFVILMQNDHLAENYPEDEDFDTSISRYIASDVFVPDRKKVAEKISIKAMVSHLEKQKEYIVLYRDISSGTPRWYEMRAVRLSENEILYGVTDKDEEVINKLVFDKLEEDFFAMFYINMESEIVEVIKDDPGHIATKGSLLSYDELMSRLEADFEGDIKDFFERNRDIDTIMQRLAKEDKSTFVYKSNLDGISRWANITELVLSRREDGIPTIIVMGFSMMDEEAGELQETQDKLQIQYRIEKESNEIIRGLASSYTILFYLNVDTGEFSVRTISDNVLMLNEDTDDSFNYGMLMDIFINKYVHPEDRESLRAYRDSSYIKEVLSDKKTVRIRFRQLQDGEYIWMEHLLVKTEDIDEEAHYVVSAFADRDSEVRAEMTQQDTLRKALDMAESANRAKTTFLNSMSHDIRTPMNAIIGFTKLAESHIDNKSRVRDYLGKIDKSSNHLLALINDILDMSRIESGTMNLEEKPEKISDIVFTLRDIVQANIRAKNHDFLIDTVNVADDAIICDKLRLNQVLLNILSNSIKYTPDGGTISMRISESQVKPSGYASYEFVIKDNGMGMDEEFLKTIFDPFTRVKSSTVSGIQGTGLGMAITKNIIDMMDGKIDIQSSIGVGTQMTVVFDFKVCDDVSAIDAEKAELEALECDFSGKKILLVEDNELNREIATEILSEYGFVIDTAEDGNIAVDKIKNAHDDDYDLILMDVQMPTVDGYEATRQIRDLDTVISKIPVIAMTANAFEEDKRRAIAAGMDAHIPKPIDIDVLKMTLSKFIR